MAEPFIHIVGMQKVYRTRGADFLAISEVTFDVAAGELCRWWARRVAARPRC